MRTSISSVITGGAFALAKLTIFASLVARRRVLSSSFENFASRASVKYSDNLEEKFVSITYLSLKYVFFVPASFAFNGSSDIDDLDSRVN